MPPVERLPSGRFRPGQSGNPAGRPRLPAEFRETVTRLAGSSAELLEQLVAGELAAPVAVRARVALGLLALGVARAGADEPPPVPVVIVQAAEPVNPELWHAVARLVFGLPADLAGAEFRTAADVAALLGWIEAGDLSSAEDIAAAPWDVAARHLAWGWRPVARREGGAEQG
jgi:hypothetical protein